MDLVDQEKRQMERQAIIAANFGRGIFASGWKNKQ